MTEEQGPLWQLKQNAKSYRDSARAFRDSARIFHDDSVRYLKKAEEASNIADEYDVAIAKLKQ